MTCIACNRDEMAGDSWATDSTGHAHVDKVHRINRWLVGFAGGMADAAKVLMALNSSELPPDRALTKLAIAGALSDVECSLLMLDPKGGIWMYEGGDSVPWRMRDRFSAIGSGGQAALGAMAAGAEPLQAVRIAKKVAAGVGGRCYALSRKV